MRSWRSKTKMTQRQGARGRAELILARDDRYPLRDVPLDPDPLTAFAWVVGRLKSDEGEAVDVVVDLLPVGHWARHRRRRRISAAEARRAQRTAGPWQAQMSQALTGQSSGRSRPAQMSALFPASSAGGMAERMMSREVAEKLARNDPVFEVQVLVSTQAGSQKRASDLLDAAVSAFEAWTGSMNRFRRVGRRFGPIEVGTPKRGWRAQRFDRRLARGLFSPAKRKVVTASEITGLLKPPTARCGAANVVRSGGMVPAPPRELLTYERQPDLLPVGWVESEDGARPVGVPLKDTFFTLTTGRSRFGKTEAAIVKMVGLARAGHGCLFLDPHADALARMKPYLTDLGERIVEVNLTARGRGAHQAAWNLFSMEGRTTEDLEMRVSAVVDSFASVLGWDSGVNNRALTVTTMAAQSLCELALVLPRELAPTLFQMTKILSDDEWREATLPHLSAITREYWSLRFPKLSPDAITPVTNLIDRLRSSANVAALFGSSRSTYDVRRAMDHGLVVLACPAGTGDKDKLISNFFIYDLLQAALSRRDIAPEDRRPFHVFVDEMQAIDGAARGNLAALLEQCGKYGIRLHAMAQQPNRLTKMTLDALLTNRSHLSSTTVGAESARLLSAEWARRVAPETLTQMAKYNFIGSFTLGGTVSPPFAFKGFELSEIWGDVAHPEAVAALDQRIDITTGRRPVTERLMELETLDRRILAFLQGRTTRPAPGPGPDGDDGAGRRSLRLLGR